MTTWVLLRGLAREARHWEAFAGLLQAAVPASDRVWAVDLPGNGRRHAERSLGVAAAADWLHQAVRDRPGPGGPCRVVALSFGGMVALEWARRHPQDVAGCVLVNSSDGRYAAPWRRLRPAALLQLALAAATRDVPARETRILRLTSNRPVDPGRVRAWAAYARECPTSAANAWRQLLAAARYRSAGVPPTPVLVLASLQDRLVDARCSRALAHAWGVPLGVHPDAGHDLALDDPAWLVAQILGWADLATPQRAAAGCW